MDHLKHSSVRKVRKLNTRTILLSMIRPGTFVRSDGCSTLSPATPIVLYPSGRLPGSRSFRGRAASFRDSLLSTESVRSVSSVPSYLSFHPDGPVPQAHPFPICLFPHTLTPVTELFLTGIIQLFLKIPRITFCRFTFSRSSDSSCCNSLCLSSIIAVSTEMRPFVHQEISDCS